MRKLILLLLLSAPCWGSCSGTYTLNLAIPAGNPNHQAPYVTVPSVTGCYSVVTHLTAHLVNPGTTAANLLLTFINSVSNYWAEIMYAAPNSVGVIDEDLWLYAAKDMVELPNANQYSWDLTVTYVVTASK